MAKTQVKSLEEYLKEWWQANKGSYDAEIAQSDKLAGDKTAAAQKEYNEEYSLAHKEYAQDDVLSAVQGYAEQERIKESAARLGLSDSGFRESALKAASGAVSNERLKLSRLKDEQVKEAADRLDTKKAEIETEAAENRQSITERYEKEASDYATAAHKADTAAAAKENTAEIKATTSTSKSSKSSTSSKSSKSSKSDTDTDSKLIYYYTGVFDKDGFMAFLGSDGKEYSFAAGVNPYTGDHNFHGLLVDGEWVLNTNWYNMYVDSDDDAKKSAVRYGVFSNGYQPRGIIQNGKDYGSLTAHETVYAKQSFTGKKQTVWVTGNSKKTRKYWMWIGSENRYVEVEKGSDGWKRK